MNVKEDFYFSFFFKRHFFLENFFDFFLTNKNKHLKK